MVYAVIIRHIMQESSIIEHVISKGRHKLKLARSSLGLPRASSSLAKIFELAKQAQSLEDEFQAQAQARKFFGKLKLKLETLELSSSL